MPNQIKPDFLLVITNQNVFQIMYSAHVGQLICVACLCVLIWDILITFDAEVEFIWRRTPRLTPIKVVFLLNRYWVPLCFVIRVYRYLVSDPSGWTCSRLGLFVYWSQIVNLYALQVGLAIRVWAIYEKNIRIAWFLILLMVGSLVSMITIYAANGEIIGKTRQVATPRLLYGCQKVNYALPESFSAINYPALALEVIFFAMTIVQVIRHRMANQGTSLMYFIARNSAIFFLFAMIVIGFGVAGSFVLQLCSPARDSNLYMAGLSINGSRLILNLRERVYNHPPSWHVTSDLKTKSSLHQTPVTNENPV